MELELTAGGGGRVGGRPLQKASQASSGNRALRAARADRRMSLGDVDPFPTLLTG